MESHNSVNRLSLRQNIMACDIICTQTTTCTLERELLKFVPHHKPQHADLIVAITFCSFMCVCSKMWFYILGII